MRRAGIVIVLTVVVFTSAARTESRTVALTFDDLPGADSRDAGELASTNLAILQALDRHHAPATGFVIGERAESVSNGRMLLERWIEHVRARKFDLIPVNRWSREYKLFTIRAATETMGRGI